MPPGSNVISYITWSQQNSAIKCTWNIALLPPPHLSNWFLYTYNAHIHDTIYISWKCILGIRHAFLQVCLMKTTDKNGITFPGLALCFHKNVVDIFFVSKSFIRTTVHESKMNAVARAQLVFQMLTWQNEYISLQLNVMIIRMGVIFSKAILVSHSPFS